MSKRDLALVWFRRDLRLSDNPALTAAAKHGAVLPVYILDEESPDIRPLGAAQKVYLHQTLTDFQARWNQRHNPLILHRGKADEIILKLIEETGASAVYWNRCYDKGSIRRDQRLKEQLKSKAIKTESFNASLLFEPWEVLQDSGQPYRVFTPFWKALLKKPEVSAPLPEPKTIPSADIEISSDILNDWKLLPTRPDWSGGIRETWPAGEDAAQKALTVFIENHVDAYARDRDRPDIDSTSRLSPRLHWGEVSPRQIWHAVLHARKGEWNKGVESYLREVGWREFSIYTLYHNPDFHWKNLQAKFDRFPWQRDEDLIRIWQKGRTGYPIVDAGMRQLWQTGWMHNRVRMIVASFLVKHLLQHWRAGEEWFWDTLVDADHGSNPAGWQWVAGSGVDAQPYFRIFNPITQGVKFDPRGDYIRRWVPELKDVPTAHLYAPWEAPEDVLRAAGVELGKTYPRPIIDHPAARARALRALEQLKTGAG